MVLWFSKITISYNVGVLIHDVVSYLHNKQKMDLFPGIYLANNVNIKN